MSVQLTVIGCGQVGTSIGLALASETEQLKRTAHDKSPETARQAQKLGAFDQVALNLHQAVEPADIVVLSIPFDEIRSTLEMIAPDLKEGCVVLDTSPIKETPTSWARELIPPGRHFITFLPTLNPACLHDGTSGIEAARADLFTNGQVFITGTAGTDGEAVQLACDLAVLIGARPFFADPAESDGLSAAALLLPRLAAAGLVNAVTGQPGWLEGRKLAGKAFAQSSSLVLNLDEASEFGRTALLNKDNAVRMLDYLVAALDELRQAISSGDEQALKSLLENAHREREKWWRERQRADWNMTIKQPEIPGAGEMFSRMLGLHLLKRRKPRDKDN